MIDQIGRENTGNGCVRSSDNIKRKLCSEYSEQGNKSSKGHIKKVHGVEDNRKSVQVGTCGNGKY